MQVMGRPLSEDSTVLRALVNDTSSLGILQAKPSTSGGGMTSEAILYRFVVPQLGKMVHESGPGVEAHYSSVFWGAQAGKSTEFEDINGWLLGTAAWLDANPDGTHPSHKSIIGLVQNGAVVDKGELFRHFPDSSLGDNG